MNPLVVRSAIVASLGGLIFGFDTAVISGTTDALKEVFHLSNSGLGFTVAIALIGTIVGALCAGKLTDMFGRKKMLLAIGILYVLGALGTALTSDHTIFMIFRFLGGVGVGAASVCAPIYTAEIAPPAARGRLVGLVQFNIVLGILVAYLSNYLIGTMMLGAEEWRWKFGIAAFPGLFLFALLFTIPHSPRWLALRGRHPLAQKILRQIVPHIGPAEEDAILSMSSLESPERQLNWARHRKPILLAFAIAAFNQLAGINAILYYINDIFAAAGFSKVSADQQSILIGATNLLFTLPALYLIDRIGRKNLLLIGSVGLCATLAGTAAILSSGLHQNLLIWMLIGFIAAFAFSQGAVIWVYISEIFPTEVRARGQSIGSSTHWLMNAIIATLFPVAAAWSKGAPFVFFAAMMVLQFFVVLIFFPETKRVALEDISTVISSRA